jgi:hypothetical protein
MCFNQYYKTAKWDTNGIARDDARYKDTLNSRTLGIRRKERILLIRFIHCIIRR